MGRFSKVGQAAQLSPGPALRMSGALGQGSARVGGASNLWTTSLQGPSFTTLGFVWRRSKAVPSSLMAPLKLVGGLAFTSDPRSAAISSIELAPRLIAMRREEPSVLMASGNGEGCPLTVGFSRNSAWPPPGFFISRSAISVISSSVATACVMRRNSPAASSRFRYSRNESNAIHEDYQTQGANGIVIAEGQTRTRLVLVGHELGRGYGVAPQVLRRGSEGVPKEFRRIIGDSAVSPPDRCPHFTAYSATPTHCYAVASDFSRGEWGHRKFFSAHSSNAKGT